MSQGQSPCHRDCPPANFLTVSPVYRRVPSPLRSALLVALVAGLGWRPAGAAGDPGLRDRLARVIDDFGLSVRSLNSLKNSNIRTLGDLVQLTEDELLKVKNVGEKALTEIGDLLRAQGLNFGMRYEEADGVVRVTDAGTAPAARAAVEAGEDA